MSTSAIAALESELESPLRSFLDSNSAIRAPHPSSSARAAPNVPSFIYDAFFLALRPNASATDAGCESYKFGAYSFCNVDVSGFYFIVMGRFGLSVALFGLAANILAFPVCFVTGIRSAASQLLAAILLCDTVTAALGVLLYCTVRFFPGTSEQLAVYQSFTVFIFPFGQPLIECAEMASIYLLVLLLFERHRYLRSGSFLRGGGCAPRNVLYAGLMVSAFSLLYSLPKFIEFQVVSDARSSTESAFLTGPYAVRTQFGNNTLYQKVYHSLLRVPIEMFIPYIAIVCFSCMLAFLICKYRMYTHLFPAYAYACLAPRAEGADAALANNVASEAEMPASPGNGHDEQPAGQSAGDGVADGPRWQKRGGDHLNLALSPAEITMKHLEQSYFALLATSMSVDADSHSDLKVRDAEGMSGNGGGGGAFAAAADSAYAAAQREAEVGGAADLATDMSMRTWIAIALYKEHLDTILVCAIAALALVCKVPQLAFRMLLGESDRFEMYAQGTGDSRNINVRADSKTLLFVPSFLRSTRLSLFARKKKCAQCALL